jgi:endoglucanase
MKRFVVFASLFLLTLHFEAVSAELTPVEKHGRLAVSGNRMVNQYGDPVQLRGMSFFWSMAGEARGYYNADVVNWLADDWKVNVVRAAMAVTNNWGADAQGYLYGNKSGDKTNEQRAFDVVDAAIAKGIYAIIDWHLESPSTDTEKAKEFFEVVARKYKDRPNIIYEIFNEPTGNAASWASTVKPYAQTVVNAIRAIDPNNIIIIGTPTWCQNIDVATADPVSGSNLVYAQHFYAASHKDSHRVKTGTAMNTNNKAVFVSEFGVCDALGDGMVDLNESTKWLDFLDSNKVSWANWSICNKSEAASALKPGTRVDGNWTANDLTESGTYIRNRLIAAHAAEPPFVPPQTFTLVYTAGANGKIQVSGSQPASNASIPLYEGNDGPTVLAVPDNGYTFVSWSDNSTANPRQDKQVSGNAEFTAHFESTNAILSADRVVPQGQTDGGAAVIAPLNILSYEFSAGPNPVSRLQSNAVNFYWHGKGIKGGKLAVYDAVGSRVNKVSLSDNSATAPAKRLVGSWGLTDAKGNISAPGSYLAKGKVVTNDGKRVKVSVVVLVK